MAPRILIIVTILGMLFAVTEVSAQDVSPSQPRTQGSHTEGLAAVPDGTRFLVRLTADLNTGRNRVNKPVQVRTLEPLESIGGRVLPAGAPIRGHISRIEPAQVMGRARVWVTFDDIRTHDGWMPIIAEVASVPGNFAAKQGETHEGEIEARSSGAAQSAKAAAGGAAVAGMSGAATHGAKGAAVAAATGGVAAFLIASGLGQEIDLPVNTKLELVLDRPLYIARR